MSEPVIRFDGVGKMYKIFPSRSANLIDSLGLARALPWRTDSYREFWALRGIDFAIGRGDRLGIIGRNGAGKTTLLKMITGNLAPTEGRLEVTGDVQALLEIGGGLHPEFTGRENIHAALVHLGLSAREIAEAEEEIADFTELGSFLDQPFKTYSLGMQARLSFGIGTTVKPEILIIDEILGAGDAYFFGKSTARMQALLEGGASVLLVSHGLDQIIRFCEHTIWLDRGRIVMHGPSVEVVKAYEKFIRRLEDRRLKAKNRKSREQRFDAFAREGYTDHVVVRMTAPAGGSLDLRSAQLFRDEELEDEVSVGAAQDADTSQSAFLQLEDAAWSPPRQDGATYLRSLAAPDGTAVGGNIAFNLWFFYPDSTYEAAVTYRTSQPGATVAFGHGGTAGKPIELPLSSEWATVRVSLIAQEPKRDTPRAGPRVSRWPGEGSLVIEEARLLDSAGAEQAVFAPGSDMILSLCARAVRPGRFSVIPAATLFRSDGILVSNHPGDPVELELVEDDEVELRLDFGPLNLGDGSYLFSVALYRTLSHVDSSVVYDLIDRSYEFEVRGNEPFNNGVFRHPAAWTIARKTVDRQALEIGQRRP